MKMNAHCHGCGAFVTTIDTADPFPPERQIELIRAAALYHRNKEGCPHYKVTGINKEG